MTISSESNIEAPSSASSRLSDVGNDLLSFNVSSPLGQSPARMYQGVGSLVFGVKDFELLHFYTTTTCFTLSAISERQQLWQNVVPQMAFTHHFLLYSLLAFSALHLALLQPDRKTSLSAQASAYHNVGLRLFRVAVSDITRDNCDACFAYASILVVYTWASSDQSGDLFFSGTTNAAGGNPTTELAVLLRGVQTLLSTSGEWIANGSMKLMLYPFAMDLELAMQANPEVTAKLAALSGLWDYSSDTFSITEVEGLNETLSLLHEAHGLIISSSDHFPVDIISIALAWPIRMPESFLVMVNQLKPEALIVLAHYSLLLKYVNHVWFMHGMSQHLLRTIHDSIGTEWENWIAWLLWGSEGR